jgi:putative peptide zinc metalloprotease protein
MQRSLYSSSWYRVANLKPRLRAHAGLHRQVYRGEVWYVMRDRTSGRVHRFTPSAHHVISMLDGEHTVDQIWDEACIRLGEDMLTQDEMIRLLAQLHAGDVLIGDVPADLIELSERGVRQRRRKLLMSFVNPLAIRVPLLDPDDFLNATYPFVRALFSWPGALVYLVTVLSACVLAAMHWSELTANIVDRVLATESLLLLLATYPMVKAVHELGHGYAIKRWGGEVHEIGVMFLVFLPVPYVDASAATVFPDKWRRALVGAAGILTELLLAALAMFVWLNAEEGLMRAFAFNVMLIGGVSTLLFNGNPLLRFDGYYVLGDVLEIPNLGTRSNRYVAYLIQRYLYGVDTAESPVTGRREAPWLFSYAAASFCYRIFIMVAIVTLVATRFFVIGVLLALWSVTVMLGVPLAKMVWFLFTSPVLRRHRGRALGATAVSILLVGGVLALVPAPYATVAQGVVWGPGEMVVHAGAEGHVAELLAPANATVVAGQPLVRMEDPLLDARVVVLEARVRELELRHAERDHANLVEARIVAEQLEHARADLALARERQEALLVRSRSAGRWIVRDPEDLPGRYFHKGDVIGYTAHLEQPLVRVIVPEDDAELVRERVRRVELRFVQRMAGTVEAEIVREVPAFSGTLPSLALSTAGGGDIAVDPTDPGGMRVLANLLHLEVRPVSALSADVLGARVYVKFSYDAEPLLFRMARTVRQVFLRRFNV